MGHQARAGWLAVLIAALGGALALGMPTAPPGDGPQAGHPRLSRLAAPSTTLLMTPSVLDALPDDTGGLTLLLAADGPAAGKGRTRLLTLEAGMVSGDIESLAANRSPQTVDADAAWLVDGQRILTWQATSPRQLFIAGPPGPGLRIVDAAKPALVAPVPPAGAGRAVLLLVLPGSGQPAAQGLAASAPSPKPPPATVPPLVGTGTGDSGTGDSEAAGDRILRIATDQRDILRLSAGVITALAAGGDGSVAAAWAEPGRPPIAGLTLIGPDGQPGWQSTLREPAHRLTVLPGSLVVAAVGTEVVALREGRIIWRRPLGGPAVGLAADGQGRVLVALADALLCLAGDGRTLWDMKPHAPVRGLRASPGGRWAALVETGQVELFAAPTLADGGDDF